VGDKLPEIVRTVVLPLDSKEIPAEIHIHLSPDELEQIARAVEQEIVKRMRGSAIRSGKNYVDIDLPMVDGEDGAW
jgi:hypothetical protein